MVDEVEKGFEKAAKALLKEILKRIREIMRDEYGLSNVSIKPIGGDRSRLSIPCKVVGTLKDERIPYFVKLIGSSDFVSSLSIQFLKNLYLHVTSKNPIFESPVSAREMAEYQYEKLKAMQKLKVPTPKPYGFHSVDDIRWILVVEYIEATPLYSTEVTSSTMETAFKHLRTIHDERIFHGDIKPDNIILGDKLYIVDIGRFRDDVPVKEKLAYDLLCMMVSFLKQFDPEEVVEAARTQYPPRHLKKALKYVDLVQRRPDFYVTDEMASKLKRRVREL